MATYVTLYNLTAEGTKKLAELPAGIEELHDNVRRLGGKVLGCYALMGEYDFVGIYELPSDEAAITLALGAGSTGSVRTKTMKAFPYTQLVEIVKKLAQA